MKKLLIVGMLGVLATAPLGAHEVIAYWPFGTNGLNDVSGNGHTLVNVDTSFGASGYANFNGVSSYMKTEQPIDLRSCRQLTVECWLKSFPLDQAFGVIMASGSPTEAGGFVLYNTFDAVGWKGVLHSQFRSMASNWDLANHDTYGSQLGGDGMWHHVAYVLDVTADSSSRARFYVDGKLSAEGKVSQPNFEGADGFLNQCFYLGGGTEYAGPNNHYKGIIDDVRITAAALEPSEFIQFPSPGAAMDCNHPVLAHWTFGPSGTKDVSENGYDLQSSVSLGRGYVACGNGVWVVTKGRMPFESFSRTGLTFELFARSSSSAQGVGMLLESTCGYYDHQGAFRLNTDAGNATVGSGLRLQDQNGKDCYNTDATTGTPPFNDGNWHHVAMVYNPAEMTADAVCLYVDGVKAPSGNFQTVTGPTCLLSEFLYIGNRAKDNSFFQGDIADVKITAGVLTPDEFERFVPHADEIAFWDFTSDTPLEDLTGNGNALSNENVAFDGTGAMFNGSDAFLKTSDAFNLTLYDQITLEMTVQFQRLERSFGVLLCSDPPGEKRGGFVVYCNGNAKLQSQYRMTDAVWNVSHFDTLETIQNDGKWHHVAYVINTCETGSSQAILYVDGNRLGCDSTGVSQADRRFLNQDFYIGGGASYGLASGNCFKGKIGQCRVSGRVLSPGSFKLSPDSQKTVPGSVLAYWRFSGDIGKDSSGNGHALVSHKATHDMGGVRLGYGSWLETESPLDLSPYAAVTVEAFVRVMVPPKSSCSVLSFENAESGGTFDVFWDADAEVLRAQYSPMKDYVNVSDAEWAALLDKRWHHVALVLDREKVGADNARFYIDGERVRHATLSGSATAFANTPFRIGDDFVPDDESEAYQVILDDVRISQGALSADQFMKIEDRPKEGLVTIIR